jgi:hypothetical protein
MTNSGNSTPPLPVNAHVRTNTAELVCRVLPYDHCYPLLLLLEVIYKEFHRRLEAVKTQARWTVNERTNIV